MTEELITITEATRNALKALSGQSRLDVAIKIVIEQLIQLRIKAAQARITVFEQKYGMQFTDFEEACKIGRIENPYSYEVEKDNWNWDAAIVEIEDLMECKQLAEEIKI